MLPLAWKGKILYILRDGWIRTQGAAVASRDATNLASNHPSSFLITHLPKLATQLPELAIHLPELATHLPKLATQLPDVATHLPYHHAQRCVMETFFTRIRFYIKRSIRIYFFIIFWIRIRILSVPRSLLWEKVMGQMFMIRFLTRSREFLLDLKTNIHGGQNPDLTTKLSNKVNHI